MYKGVILWDEERVTGDQGQRTVTKDSADVMIPSLQALRHSADIHRKVSQRYQELEDSAQLKQSSLDVLLHNLSQRVKKIKNQKLNGHQIWLLWAHLGVDLLMTI